MRKTLASVLRKTSSRSRPWQIAMGAAIGVIVGSAVHSPFLLVACIAVAFWLPLHALACAVSAVLVATIVTMIAPPLGALGEWSLQHPALIAFWQRLESLPLVPWLGLHNTVVNGACIIGVIAAIPSALSSWLSARWILSEIAVNETLKCEWEEDSFVELSPVEIQQLERLTENGADLAAAGVVDESQDSSEEHLRIDLAAMDVPSPSFPVRNFEVDSAEVTETDATSLSQPRSDATDFEVPDFVATDETLDASTSAESSEQSGKPESIYAFDAVARLEELLSGCRVQPHWTNDKQSQDSDRKPSEDAEPAGTFLRIDDEHTTKEGEQFEDGEGQAVPTCEEILQRSGEIAGLVDQLIATLHEDDDSQAVSELHFDVAPDASPTVPPNNLGEAGDKSETSPRPLEKSSTSDFDASSGLQLRFDQIDISEKFAQPLYQPHQPNDTDDLKVSVRASGKSPTRQQIEQQIERAEPFPPPASSRTSQATRKARLAAGERVGCESDSEKQCDDKTTESLIHVVQRGHDEALRHLLHHLREIEDRVRK